MKHHHISNLYQSKQGDESQLQYLKQQYQYWTHVKNQVEKTLEGMIAAYQVSPNTIIDLSVIITKIMEVDAQITAIMNPKDAKVTKFQAYRKSDVWGETKFDFIYKKYPPVMI